MTPIARVASLLALVAGSPLFLTIVAQEAAERPDPVPTLRQVMDLTRTRRATISPDGRRVAFVEAVPDWDADGWMTRLLVSDGGPPVSIDNAEGFRGSYRWTPDSEWLVYIARSADSTVLRLVRADGRAATRTSTTPTRRRRGCGMPILMATSRGSLTRF